MIYRKFLADRLFNGYKMLEHPSVLVTRADGVIEDLLSPEDAGDDVEVVSGILSPGFVNCHCHLELSHLKGLIPEKTGLTDFVFSVVTQRHFPAEVINAAIKDGEEEMFRNGTVAVGDICNNAHTLQRKKNGRLQYYNFIELSGWSPGVAATRFAAGKSLYEEFAAFSPSGRHLSISPHAPYSVSDELWTMIRPYYAGKTATLHNQETPAEDELFKTGKGDFLRMYQLMNIDNSFFHPPGISSLQASLPRLEGAENILLVHNTFTREEDLQFLDAISKQSSVNIFCCLCIRANLFIENAVPPVELFRENAIDLVLGTDSLASNHSLNLLDEMRTLQHHFPSLSLEEMLPWATLNGASALQMDAELGSFEEGKRPGVVLIEDLQGGKITADSRVKRLV
ncbi:MAG TPA: amidohydrolase family protein [Puia sp.]|nr:amidohydrolase family protein [Puia sp.]